LSLTGGTLPYKYAWANGPTTAVITHLSTGNYIVTITDVNGCTAANAFSLVYDFDFRVAANPSATIKLGQSATLGYTLSGYAGTYTNTWSPAASLSCPVCPDPVATPNVTTLYNITVQNDSGCAVSDMVTIYVIPDYDIFVPNAFTPNGDGKNDYFSIYGNTQVLEFLEVKVFDRIGEQVYESYNINFKWDGSFKGAILPSGVFVWELKLVFIDGHTEKLRKGSVTLLR
jgi:gliding motility-associated-like protein